MGGNPPRGNAVARGILAVSVTIPVVVWLCIGLPLAVEADWQFSFYFPIVFIAGALTLMSLLIFPIVHKQALAQTLVAGYALTNRCAIIVAADPRRKAFGTHGASLVNNMESGMPAARACASVSVNEKAWPLSSRISPSRKGPYSAHQRL